jgi:Cellulase (glycosyl hydrolase family 5)
MMQYFRMMWAGVEPQPQNYNATYLNIMKQIVELLQSNGIFVLFDMHQDVLSGRTGSYDGIPGWLYDRFPPPAHPCNEIFNKTNCIFF